MNENGKKLKAWKTKSWEEEKKELKMKKWREEYVKKIEIINLTEDINNEKYRNKSEFQRSTKLKQRKKRINTLN